MAYKDRGYGTTIDNYKQQQEKKKQKQEQRKQNETKYGPVSAQKATTLSLPKVNSTATSRAASTSAPIQTQRFTQPGFSGSSGKFEPTSVTRGNSLTQSEFNRSPAMIRSYGNYDNYLKGVHVTGSGFSDPDLLFSNEPDLKAIETAQNQFDQALNVVSGNFEQKASAYERWYRTVTNQYQPMTDAQKAQGDQLYADYTQALSTYQKMADAHMSASAHNAGIYASVSNQRKQWYDSIRDEKDIDVEEKDLLSQLELLENQRTQVESANSYAKTQALHGITTAEGLETVMNSTDELNRIDRQIEEVRAQIELLDKERAYSRYFKWQNMANNDMPVSAIRVQGRRGWLEKAMTDTGPKGEGYKARNDWAEEQYRAINEGNINPSNIAEMLDDERQTYQALYEKYGPDVARQYYEELEKYGNIRESLNTRRRMTDEASLRKWVEKGSPFGRQLAASVLTVLASPTKAFSYVGQGAEYLLTGEMTKDADYNVFSYAPNAVTAQIGQNITKWGEEHGSKWVQEWGEFGYQTALSMLTFLYTTALTGGFGLSAETMEGVALYEQGYRTAQAVSAYKAYKTAETLSLGLMGTEAAADAVMQAKDRGLDDGQAFWMGTAAGAIEILTEKFSVENLLEGVGDRNRLLYFLKNVFAEGSEEVASDLSNMLVDSLVAKDKSEFNQSVKDYMKQYGVSKEEALKAVWTQQLKNIGLSGLGGALSGGVMAGGRMALNTTSNYLFNRNSITSPENVARIASRGQDLSGLSEGYRSAQALQAKLASGEKMTVREVLRAREAIETDRKTDPKYVGALIEAAQDYGDSDAKKQADKLQAKLDNGKVKVEDVENLEEAIDLDRLVDPNREDLQSALKYGETADQKSEAYVLTKGIRDKIAAGEKLSLEEVSAAESAVNTAKATSAEGLKSTIESGLASDQNSPAYRAAQQLQSKLDSGAEITLAEVNEAKRAVRADENAAYKSMDPNVVGKYLVTENGRKALTDAATILKNSTSESDVQRGNQILQAIKDGNLDAKTAGEVFLRSQKILENTRKQRQNIRVLKPREVTADMDAYDRSAAELGISEEEASHNKAILQAFGVEGEYRSFENNKLSAYYDRSTGKVYINANADNPGLALIAHEVTHSFENTAGYKKLANLVFSQSKDLNADLDRITQEYADAGVDLDADGNPDRIEAKSELVSEFVEQHMFNDEKFIRDVVDQDRSFGHRVLNWLDDMLAKLGNKNAQERQMLRHARDLWAEALRQRKTSDKAKAKIAKKKSEAKKLTLPAVEQKAAAVRKTEGPNLPKAESRKIQTANAELNQYGINIDADSGAAVSYSIRTAPTTVDEIKLATDRLVNAGFDRADAESWLKSLTSVSSVIMQNMQELDYEADERYTWLKTNSEYTQGSVDFNNNCPKRAQFTAVFDRLQQMMPDRVFTASDYETIRQILIKHKIPVTCGPCFVEDRRQHTGEIAQKFIDQLKSGELKNKFQSKIGNDTYVPTQYDLVTYEGLQNLYKSHRGIHDAFVAFNNARGMQAARLLEGLAEYNNQIKKWNKRTISSKNGKGGLRIFSLSDADPRNMIDMIQIVTDSAEKGLMIQGYTKKPWFARFIKDTGVRILRSHIPAGNGVRNGKLAFDNVEGINTNDPDYFDATNERNIGDTVIGINDEMIRIAMLDPSIDQIIPFHTQLAKDIRDQKKIGHWTPYNGLEDRNVSDGKKADKQINIYTDVLQAWEKKGTPITNRQEFVEAFLQVCDERGLIPRFDKFLNVDENGKYVYTPGYEKFLVDFKLFDRTTGEIIPQEAVKPIFDDAYNQSVLENYVKNAKNLPKVSEDVFDEIKRHFTDDKLSLPKAESKQYAISKSDTAYLKAVESGDMETAQRMVDEAARRAGYPLRLMHGTNSFGFTSVDFGESDDNVSFFATDSEEVAASYVRPMDDEDAEPTTYVRQIGKPVKNRLTEKSSAPVLLAELKKLMPDAYKDTTTATEADIQNKSDEQLTVVKDMARRLDRYSLPDNLQDTVQQIMNAQTAQEALSLFDTIKDVHDVVYNGEIFVQASAALESLRANINLLSHVANATPETVAVRRIGKWTSLVSANRLYENYLDYSGMSGRGIYDIYTTANNPLTINCRGANWRSIQTNGRMEGLGETASTREIAKWAHEHGYGTVIFENVRDTGKYGSQFTNPSTVYAFLKDGGNSFKSADPVTYDDSGKPIPLSERFNPQNPDIRYAINKGEAVYNGTVLLKEETIDKYLKAYAAKDIPEYAQAYIARISPDDFVRLTTSRRGREWVDETTKPLDVEKLGEATRDQPFFLDIDTETGEVTGHEGRHRANALAREGIRSIPVLLFDYSTKRSKTALDHLMLTGQNFGQYGRSYATAYLRDVQPLSYGNRDAVVEKFTSQPPADRYREKYEGRETIRYAINKDATIRTEGELIDSIIDPKETARAGVEDALDDYLDSIGAGSDIPGMDKISTGTKRNAKLPAKYKAQEAARFFYRKMVDSGEAVTRLGRYSNDPHLYHYYNMARASSNAAVSMIQDAQTDVMGRRVGDSLNDIFSAIRKKGEQYYADLQAYLYHTHNIDRMSRENPGAVASAQAELEQFRHDNPELAGMADFQIERLANDPISFYHDQAKAYMQILRRLRQAAAQHNKPVFGQEVSAEQSRRAAEDLREKLSETEGFEEDVEKIYQYIDNLMQYRIDSGLITEEEYERLKEIYPHYVPTFREQEPAARNKRGNTTEIGKTVGRAQGGDTRLIPLHRALAQQTFSVVREGSKNRFGQMLLEGKQNSSRGMIKNVEEAESGFHEDTFDEEDVTPKKENTFIVRQGGKRYEIGMDNALYEAVTALSPEPSETNFLINLVHKSNDLFKALCTGYNPTFLVRNFMRDLQDAGLYSKDLSEFSKQYPLAYKEITTNGKYWQMYKALGGLYSSFFDYQTGELKQPGKVKKYTVDAIESVNMAVEQAPRLAEFMATVKKAEKAGNLSMDTLMEAIYNAADVTVNFGRSGKWGKMFNRSVVPFFNPGVQGFDKMVRNVTETKGFKDWARLAAKATILGIAPAIISRLLFGKRKDWDEIKQRDKDIYYLFPLQDGVWLKLPKGRVLSVFGMAADRAMQGKDADWASFIETSLTQTAPENPLTASYWRPWLDAKLFDKDDPGKTWYGSDIENQRLRNLAPGQRYDTTTDALSKWLGKKFGLSPKKINYLLDQYSGVIGDVLLPLTSDRAEKGLFTNAFTIDSVVSNQLSEDFYDMKDRLTWAKNDPNATGEDEAVYKYWNQQTSAISDINKAIRAIEQDESLTDKEKRDLTRVQYSLRNGIMRNALDTLDDYRKAVEEAYASSTKTDPDDRLDEAYREANKNMFGAEYALQTYNKKVYEAATQLREDNGISYDGFYKFYFARQEVQDQPGTSAECELIMKQDMNDSQKQALYEKYISHKPITLDEGMTMDDFLQAKIDKAEAASEPKISDVMESQAKQNNPNWDSMDSKQQKYATWDEAAKSGNDDALTSSMSESEARKYQTATDHGIDTDVFVSAYKAVDQADLDNDANRSYKQEEVKTALDSMDLTNEQRAVLWQVISSAKSGKNNPYDPDLGQQIYDEMQASKSASAGSQTKPAPIRPMGLRLPKIG